MCVTGCQCADIPLKRNILDPDVITAVDKLPFRAAVSQLRLHCILLKLNLPSHLLIDPRCLHATKLITAWTNISFVVEHHRHEPQVVIK